MLKKVFLSESQMRYIEDELGKDINIPAKILASLESKETYIPLNDVSFSKKLLNNQYKESLSAFSDDIAKINVRKVYNHFNKLLSIVRKKEQNIRPQLEKICYNTIVQLFSIPEDEIHFSCELVDNIDSGMEFHISPDTNEDYEYENVGEMESENAEVEKRKLINMLVMGSSLTFSDKSKKYYLNEIFDIDEELPHLYSKLTKLNEYLLFNIDVRNTDKQHNQGGYVEVRLGDEQKISKIEVKAITFPILLSESIKGLMELVSAHGLPDNLNMARMVMNKADVLEEEPWNMRFGKQLWKMVTLKKDLDTKIIPDFFKKLIDIDASDFISLIKELSCNTKQGKKAIEILINDCNYSKDYSDVEDNMLKKQEDKDLIEDEYFTEDELYEGTLSEYIDKDTFNLRDYINGEGGGVTDIICKEPQYFKDFFEEMASEQYWDWEFEEQYDNADEYLHALEHNDINAMAKWILNNANITDLRKYSQYLNWRASRRPVNTNQIMREGEIVRNRWMIHFSDAAHMIAKNGFTRGINNFDDLGYAQSSGYGGKYNFAYLVDDYEDTYMDSYGNPKYGDEAVMFVASGVRAYHDGDEEYQVIFDGRTARNIVYLEYDNYEGCWIVKNPVTDRYIKKYNSLEDIVNWVVNNYDTYRKSITSISKQDRAIGKNYR